MTVHSDLQTSFDQGLSGAPHSGDTIDSGEGTGYIGSNVQPHRHTVPMARAVTYYERVVLTNALLRLADEVDTIKARLTAAGIP